jgi:hypothetical protein
MKYVALLFILVGCASTTPGYKSKDIKKPKLETYVDQETGFPGDRYALYVLSFRNNSNEWKRVKSARLEFFNEQINKDAKILVGEDLVTWSKSITHEKNVSNYNRNLILGSIGIGAFAVSVGTNNPTGSYIALGALSALVIDKTYKNLKEAEILKLVPQDHLLPSFSVAPGLVTQKWIVIENHLTPFPSIKQIDKSIKVTIEYLDGQIEVHTI